MEVGDFLGDGVLVRSEKELGCCSQQMQCVILLSICCSLQLIMHKKKCPRKLFDSPRQERIYKKDTSCKI